MNCHAAPSPHLINLKGQPSDALARLLAPLGVPEKQARQIMARVVYHHDPDLSQVRGLSHARRRLLEEATCLPSLTLVERIESPIDHFTRFLFRTHDAHLVEAVRIPLLADRYSVCISSQVGCALGCVFCETGRLGFRRNLEAWEMVDQVMQVRDGADRPVTGAVFMGQGEPLLNYDEVIKAANVLRDPVGLRITGPNITISTAGILPAMHRYIDEGHPFRLILSLSAATTEKRRQIMPIEKKYALPDLITALARYASSRRTRATIAWVAMQGVNSSPEDIAELKALIGDLPIRFNLIEVNDPSGKYTAPVGEDFRRFLDALRALEVPIVRRYTGGKDVNAACGMLAARSGAPSQAQPDSQAESGVG